MGVTSNTNNTDTLAGPDFQVISRIRSEADLPPLQLAPDGAMRHFLTKGTFYQFDIDVTVPFFLANGFYIEGVPTANFENRSLEALLVSTILYTGSDSLIFNDGNGAVQIKNLLFVALTPGTTAFEIEVDSATVQAWSFVLSNLIGFDDLGFIKNTNLDINRSGFFNYKRGLVVDSAFAATAQLLILNNQAVGSSNSPGLIFTGNSVYSSGIVELIIGGLLFNESVVAIDSSAKLSTHVYRDSNFVGTAGTSFFQADLSGAITAFADSVAAPGVDTTVTSVGHNLSIFRTTAISGTTNYNATFTVTRIIDDDNFDIDTAFVADDATGDFLTQSLNETSVNVNAQNNGVLRDSRKTASMIILDGSEVATTINAVNTPVKINGAFTIGQGASAPEEFSIDSSGRMTYIGISPIPVTPFWTFEAEVSSGSNRLLQFMPSVGNDLINIITAFTDQGGGVVRVTTLNTHDVVTGMSTPITNSGTFNGTHVGTRIDDNNFDITFLFTAAQPLGNFAIVETEVARQVTVSSGSSELVVLTALEFTFEPGGYAELFGQNNVAINITATRLQQRVSES